MERLDLELVRRGLSETRARAQRAIEGGYVRVNGNPIAKASAKISENDNVEIHDPNAQWVSRAALKILPFLEHAENTIGLDLGASTGGFTQVLITRGARKVFAVDVGHDQLHPSLRGDKRVMLAEGLNVKNLDAKSFTDEDWPNFNIITSDLSFISLKKALPATLDLAQSGTLNYALVKPQFELDPSKIGKGGLVKNPEEAHKVVEDMRDWFERQNWQVLSLKPAPIAGTDGNQEYVLKALKL